MRQVLRAGALGRPRGMGWRGRREGGLGWGTHVNPWLIHVNLWQKPLQYCKVISLQLIKINGKTKQKIKIKGILVLLTGEQNLRTAAMIRLQPPKQHDCHKEREGRISHRHICFPNL